MVQFLGYGDWLSVRVDGPLWFRGYDKWTDEEGMAQIGKVLEAYDAAHIAVGHTVQKGGRIRPRFDNKVFLIDTGMLSVITPAAGPQRWKFAAIPDSRPSISTSRWCLFLRRLPRRKAELPGCCSWGRREGFVNACCNACRDAERRCLCYGSGRRALT